MRLKNQYDNDWFVNFILQIKIWFIVKYDSIMSLIKWFRVIWNDRNWDQQYTYDILIHKLKLQRDYFKNKLKRSQSGKYKNEVFLMDEIYIRNIKEIEFTIRLIDRISNGDYYTKQYNKMSETDNFVFEDFEDKKYKSLKIENTKYTEEERNKIMKDYIEYEKFAFKRDEKILGKMLVEKMSGWWD